VSDFDPPGGIRGASGAQPKRDLRRNLIAARRSMSEQNKKNQDSLVRRTLVTWLTEINATIVAAYVPMIGEPGGPELPSALAHVVFTLLLPVVQPDRDLDWAAHDGRLAPAALGLMEPVGPRLGLDAIATASVVIVPALAVDRSGIRLGRGGGSYDRALARVGAGQIVIAPLYDGELVATVPSESHDRRVDGVIIGGVVTMLSPGHGSGPAGRWAMQ
jgi:5-formyltetrahydrofolate cyclo-ligase